MNLFDVIKKNIKILAINKNSFTIGTKKGFWSKGLEFGDKRRLKMKKVSSEWVKDYGCIILDPDGWDRKNFDYSFNKEKITRQEFEKRLIVSTVKMVNTLPIKRLI